MAHENPPLKGKHPPEWVVPTAVVVTILAVLGGAAGGGGTTGGFVVAIFLNPIGWAGAYLWWLSTRITCPHCGAKNPRNSTHQHGTTRQTCAACRTEFALVDLGTDSEVDSPVPPAEQNQTGIPSKSELEPPEGPQESEAERRLAANKAERKRVIEEARRKRKAVEEEKRLAEKAERKRVAKEAEQKRKAEEEQERLAEEAEQKRNAEESERKQNEHSVPAADTTEPGESNNTLSVAVVSFFLGVAVTSLLVYVIMYDVKVEERRPDDEFTDLEQGTTLEESGEYPALMTNSIGMNLKLIPAGVFLMGSPVSEAFRGDHESQHRVRITKPFYIQTTEVTWGQWKSVMGAERWRGQFDGGDNYAANYVSHDDAVEFLRKLSAREGVTYRLPTEAEWEYACRGGSTGMYSFGTSVGQLGQYAWFKDNAYDINEKYVHRVGQNRANDFGLYDMHGNVFEWCSDWYDKDYYKSSSVNDPQGPSSGSFRVRRGGCWFSGSDRCRSALRGGDSPDGLYDYLGFRVVRSPVK